MQYQGLNQHTYKNIKNYKKRICGMIANELTASTRDQICYIYSSLQ